MSSQIADTSLPALMLSAPQRSAQGKSEGRGEGKAAHAQSWEREMERAQMELWLGKGVVGYKPLAAVRGVPEPTGIERSDAFRNPGTGTAGLRAREGRDDLQEQSFRIPPSDRSVQHARPEGTGPQTWLEAPSTARAEQPWQAGPYTERAVPGPGDVAAYTAQMAAALQAIAPMELSVTLDGVAVPVDVGSAKVHQGPHPIDAPAFGTHAAAGVEAPAARFPAHPAMPWGSPSIPPAIPASIPAPGGPVRSAQAPGSTASATEATLGSPAATLQNAVPGTAAAPGTTSASMSSVPAAALIQSPAAASPSPTKANVLHTALSHVQSNHGASVAAIPTRGPDRTAEAPIAGRIERAGQAAAPTRDPGPIRLHVDWTGGGVRLWLGMNAELLPQLQAIANQLQSWVSAQGLRLLGISCNGRDLGTDPPTGDTFESSNEFAAANAVGKLRQNQKAREIS